jgi:antitoxin Phd
MSSKKWPVQDAKARFSEFLDACERDGPQVVSRRGKETAVLVPIAEWQRLSEARRSLKDLLTTDSARATLSIPARGRHKRRRAPDL